MAPLLHAPFFTQLLYLELNPEVPFSTRGLFPDGPRGHLAAALIKSGDPQVPQNPEVSLCLPLRIESPFSLISEHSWGAYMDACAGQVHVEAERERF